MKDGPFYSVAQGQTVISAETFPGVAVLQYEFECEAPKCQFFHIGLSEFIDDLDADYEHQCSNFMFEGNGNLWATVKTADWSPMRNSLKPGVVHTIKFEINCK